MSPPWNSWKSTFLMKWLLKLLFMARMYNRCLNLGRAQGVAMAAVLSRDIPVFEYAPRKIKLSITSAGDASKEQVAGMLMRMFDLKVMPKNLDATDGLAAAVCHFYQNGHPCEKHRIK